MPGRKITVFNILIIAAAAAVLVLMPLYGKSRRTYLQKPVLEAVKEPRECLSLWRTSGVFGRVLFQFDRRLRANYDSKRPAPDDDNYVYMAVNENFVRTVYHIVPDASWQEVVDNLLKVPTATAVHGGFRFSLEGTPVFVMRARDVVPVKEKVLINIYGGFWEDEGLPQIIRLLAGKVISGDVITVTGNISDNGLQSLWTANHEHF